MEKLDYKEVGQRIREARDRLEITQEQLAERASLSVNHISAIERGKAKASLDAGYRIAIALGLSPNQLTGYEHSFSREASILISLIPSLSLEQINFLIEQTKLIQKYEISSKETLRNSDNKD